MRTLVAVALLALPLLAFGNEANDIIQGLPDAKRNMALAMFMQRSGESCGRVTRTFFQGLDSRGDAFWDITCDDGKSWSVMIYNDANGSTKILECAVLKAAGGGTCFKKFRH